MLENQNIRPAQVIGPLGEPLTLDSLPPADTDRWVVRRKAEVVAAVAGGLLSVDEACQRYTLSLEEFTSWQRAVERSGMPGLRVTRIKHYRDVYERQQRHRRAATLTGWFVTAIHRPADFRGLSPLGQRPSLDTSDLIRNNGRASSVFAVLTAAG